MEFTPAVNQIWRDKDIRRVERFVKVIAVDETDALVRSCDLRGEFCPKTPRTMIGLNRLRTRFKLVVTPATLTVTDEWDSTPPQEKE